MWYTANFKLKKLGICPLHVTQTEAQTQAKITILPTNKSTMLCCIVQNDYLKMFLLSISFWNCHFSQLTLTTSGLRISWSGSGKGIQEKQGFWKKFNLDQEKEFLNLDQEIRKLSRKLKHFEQMATISGNQDTGNNN